MAIITIQMPTTDSTPNDTYDVSLSIDFHISGRNRTAPEPHYQTPQLNHRVVLTRVMVGFGSFAATVSRCYIWGITLFSGYAHAILHNIHYTHIWRYRPRAKSSCLDAQANR